MSIENKTKKIDVWHEDDQEWVEYTLKELDEYFHFVKKPNWNNVREICLHNGGFNPWIDVIFKNTSRIYNKVYGTYVEQ
ncbi:hypothetical protein [Clostridium sporogenes]|uniref:hypothetical protein n=1 Tax=Clostridium sporogenes TaxID=1509 RepID=UPI000773D685|nr:hypothetical protein [Clostridium sporogenes]